MDILLNSLSLRKWMVSRSKSSRMAASIKFVMVFVYGLAAHSTASTIRVTKASASCMCRKVCVCVCVCVCE